MFPSSYSSQQTSTVTRTTSRLYPDHHSTTVSASSIINHRMIPIRLRRQLLILLLTIISTTSCSMFQLLRSCTTTPTSMVVVAFPMVSNRMIIPQKLRLPIVQHHHHHPIRVGCIIGNGKVNPQQHYFNYKYQYSRLFQSSTSTTSGGSNNTAIDVPTMDTATTDMVTDTKTDTSSSTTSTTSPDTNNTPKSTNKGPKIRRILSGVQPTGSLHLGNYFGAIQQWVTFQNKYCPIIDNTDTSSNASSSSSTTDQKEVITIKDENEITETTTETTTIVENYFCVVDLHAITSTQPQTPDELYRSSLMSVALYIAAGIDPKRSKIFIQSHVSAHTEMAWLLQCITPINWIERMIQYKEKAKKMNENVSTGLMTYPILMASDILLYQATEVPVGEDQRQHLELTRDIVRRFHDLYCTGNTYKKRMKQYNLSSYPVFTEPNAMIASTDTGTSRIMSLTDGTNKMSKSDPNDNSRINLLDPPDLIRDKIKKCKTDAYVGIEWNNPNRPEATNLLNIYAAVQPHRTREDIINEVQDMTWGAFKPLLAEEIINHIVPIQTKYYEIMSSSSSDTNTKTKTNEVTITSNEYLKQVLQDGAYAANTIASQTLYKTKIAMGFVVPEPMKE
jgi:tryptophanyl-tRNA synthetase